MNTGQPGKESLPWSGASMPGRASAGKIAGAGGGGFLLLYVPYERQSKVREVLKDLQELPFRLESDGTKIIFNYRRS